MQVEAKPGATWIWYPGDFEIWLREESELRRIERGGGVPSIWKLDRHYSNVCFRKTICLERPERAAVVAEGTLHIQVNGQLADSAGALHLNPGTYEIRITVTNRLAVPSLYIAGSQLQTDDSWETTAFNGYWTAAGSARFHDPNQPPSSFKLATARVEPVASTIHEDRNMLVDFGKETFGYVAFHGISGSGKVRVQYGESRQEALDETHGEVYEYIDLDGSAESYVNPYSRAFRYLYVLPEPSVHISGISMQYEYLPVDKRGAFRCSDELLNRIWDVSSYTFHLNTREFFLDGIKRDRWVWSGDAYQSFLMNYYHFFELDVTKRTLLALRGKDPVEMHINTILDYSFFWFMSMYDYYLYTGDKGFLRKYYPRMVSLMDFCLGRSNANGYVEGRQEDWVFIDWADLDNRGEVSTEQLLLARSLEIMADTAELCGEPESASSYRERFLSLKEQIMEDFWSESHGGLLHHRRHGQLQPLFTKHASMFALLFGYVDDRQAERIKENVLLHPELPPIKTPYMRFYELDALCGQGEHHQVLRELRSYWGGMLNLGATTFWEEYDPGMSGDEHLAMYGRPYGKSLCHAWGATPLYVLGRHFLGVRPASPGYETFVAEPRLGDLQWLEGAVPTPNGDIHVHMDTSSIRIRFSHGSGTLRISSKEPPSTSSGTVRRAGADLYELEMPAPGEYQISYVH